MQTETVIELAERNGDVVTAAMAHEAGADRSLLRHLCRTGRLECVERGVYAMPGSWVDEPYIAQIRFGRGVFSHNTALWLHGLSDRTPDAYDMTFPRGYNTTSARKAGIAARTAGARTYVPGVERVATPSDTRSWPTAPSAPYATRSPPAPAPTCARQSRRSGPTSPRACATYLSSRSTRESWASMGAWQDIWRCCYKNSADMRDEGLERRANPWHDGPEG